MKSTCFCKVRYTSEEQKLISDLFSVHQMNPVCVWQLKRQSAALLYLLSVGLRVSSRCEESQDGPQETLINFHCHLLNQSHEVPEVHKQSTH